MPNAISNTSPLLYLYRVGVLEWLHDIFGEVLVPEGVVEELREGRRLGFDAPNPEEYVWMRLVNPTRMPSEWLSLDLGPGELAAMALALENRECIVLLDDMLARKTAKAAGRHVALSRHSREDFGVGRGERDATQSAYLSPVRLVARQ